MIHVGGKVMEEKKAWYLAKRAKQLAIVYLSRRDDLIITEHEGPDFGVDLLVTLTKDGNYTGRVFGVEVKALRSHQQPRRISSDVDGVHLNIGKVAIPKDIPFPLCLFAFIMENDEGYYRWIKEPIYGVGGEPHLAINATNAFRKLDSKAINDIVAEVNNWYENKLKIPA